MLCGAHTGAAVPFVRFGAARPIQLILPFVPGAAPRGGGPTYRRPARSSTHAGNFLFTSEGHDAEVRLASPEHQVAAVQGLMPDEGAIVAFPLAVYRDRPLGQLAPGVAV